MTRRRSARSSHRTIRRQREGRMIISTVSAPSSLAGPHGRPRTPARDFVMARCVQPVTFVLTEPNSRGEGRGVFQIVRMELDCDGHVLARQPLQPPYDLWKMPRRWRSSTHQGCEGDYGYDEEHACWWARDDGRSYRFAVEPVVPAGQVGGSRCRQTGFSRFTLRIRLCICWSIGGRRAQYADDYDMRDGG